MATLTVRVQRVFIVDRDLFARLNVAQGEEQHVTMERFHVSVRRARVIDVVRAVAAATAVQAPTAINVTDAQFGAAGTPLCFQIGNSFARVFGDLFSTLK